MNAKELSKRIPASKKQATIYLDDRVETPDDVSFTYHFKGQKQSHLKVSRKEWNKYEFDVLEDDTVLILKHPGIIVITNESGWKRLGKPQEDKDE